MSILGSMGPAERAAMIGGLFNIGAGAIGQIGQGAANKANQQTTLGQSTANNLTNLLNQSGDMRQYFGDRSRAGAKAGVQLGPLAIQQALGNNAMKRAFYFGGEGGAPQYITPGDSAIAAQMGKLPTFRGAERFFTDRAVMADPYWKSMAQLSEGTLTPNFSDMGMQGTGAQQGELDDFANRTQSNFVNEQQGWEQEKNATRQAVMQALQQDQQQQQQKKKSGFWSKLGGALKFAAPIAASFIPGVGPIAGALISAGANAAGTKMQGGSWGDAALAGAVGGAAGWAGGKINPFGKGAPVNFAGVAPSAASAGVGPMMLQQGVLQASPNLVSRATRNALGQLW